MANYNKVILMGNLTRDPELRYTPKGLAVATLGLAINRRTRTESGEVKDEVTFVDVDAFGKTAENICQYFKKGRPILIEGRLRYDTWDDKQTGQKRSKLRVVGENFAFVDSKAAEGANAAAPAPAPRPAAPPPPAPAPAAPPPEEEAPSPPEDDVPF